MANYQTSSQVSSAISSALSSYDDSSQVDNKIITALLDFYTRAETDQEIADALSNVAATTTRPGRRHTWPTSSWPITRARSWTRSSRPPSRSTGPAGAPKPKPMMPSPAPAPGPDGRRRPLLRAGSRPGKRTDLQLGAGAVHAQNHKEPAPRGAAGRRRDSGEPVHAAAPLRLLDQGGSARLLRTNHLGPLDARYFVTAPGAEGGGIFQLSPNPIHPRIIRNLLCQTPLSAQPILGNGSTLQISCNC